jgi:8-oxo-dGTP diphosphatase
MTLKNNIHVLSRAVIIDQGHILLCKTLDLPVSFYFLPGGHIEHGESAEVAVVREVLEESGSECTIKRFLGCLEYSFEPGYSSICHNHEYNFIFEVESTALKAHLTIPQLESHIYLTWVPLSKIDELDFRPEPLKTLISQWLELTMKEAFRSVMV